MPVLVSPPPTAAADTARRPRSVRTSRTADHRIAPQTGPGSPQEPGSLAWTVGEGRARAGQAGRTPQRLTRPTTATHDVAAASIVGEVFLLLRSHPVGAAGTPVAHRARQPDGRSGRLLSRAVRSVCVLGIQRRCPREESLQYGRGRPGVRPGKGSRAQGQPGRAKQSRAAFPAAPLRGRRHASWRLWAGC